MKPGIKKYANGGPVTMPGKETRKLPPRGQLPPPKKGPKPKRLADGGQAEKPKPKPEPKPGDKPPPKPTSSPGLAERLKTRSQRELEALGLKNGGKVRKKR